MRSKNSAEAWMAQCLRDEANQLAAAVRTLEFEIGYATGVKEAQVAA